MADVFVFPFCTWKAPPAYFICTCATRTGFSLCLPGLGTNQMSAVQWEVKRRIYLKWHCSITEVHDPELVQSLPRTETPTDFWPQSTKLSPIWPPANIMAHRAQPCGAALLDITPPDHQAELSVAREQMWGSGCCQNTTKRALNLIDMRTNPIVMSAVEVQTGNTE